MTSLVTPGTALDPYEAASADVRGYCNQLFDHVVDDVVLVDPRPDRSAQLPEMPVSAVTLVEAYMPDSNGAWGWQTLTSPGQFGWNSRGRIWDASRTIPPIVPTQQPMWPYNTWPWLSESLRVTYTHGYQNIPMNLQQVVLSLAAWYAANPTRLQSRKVGEVSSVFGMGGIALLRPEERTVLDRYVVQEV